jgi:hypothetical protein
MMAAFGVVFVLVVSVMAGPLSVPLSWSLTVAITVSVSLSLPVPAVLLVSVFAMASTLDAGLVSRLSVVVHVVVLVGGIFARPARRMSGVALILVLFSITARLV